MMQRFMAVMPMMLLLISCANPRVEIASPDPAQLAACPDDMQAQTRAYVAGIDALPLVPIVMNDGRIVVLLRTVNERSYVTTAFSVSLLGAYQQCRSVVSYVKDWTKAVKN